MQATGVCKSGASLSSRRLVIGTYCIRAVGNLRIALHPALLMYAPLPFWQLDALDRSDAGYDVDSAVFKQVSNVDYNMQQAHQASKFLSPFL